MFLKRIITICFVSNLFAQIDTVLTIDASSYSNWVYFSFEQAQVIDVENPEESMDWDVAFQRKHIRTNSGLSGVGNGGAIVDSSTTWLSQWNGNYFEQIETPFVADTLLNDFYDIFTHTFNQDTKNPALNAWGWFDEDYQLNTTNYVFYVLLPNGQDVVKFWPQNYYSETGGGGNIQLRYETGLSYEQTCNQVLGDVNNDSLINVVDVVQLVNYILNGTGLQGCEIQASDFNQDDQINVVDIVNLVGYILNN